jgi:hypothetical protein
VTLSRCGKHIEITHADFIEPGNFRLGYCDSVCRNQGYTHREPYNIYDVKKMWRQDFYTAVGRHTRHEDIGFDAAELKDHVFPLKTPPDEVRKLKLKPLINKLVDALIYKIFDAFGNEYIGYTTRTLDERYQEHLTDSNEPEVMKEWLEKANTQIVLVRSLKCIDLKEVKAIEAAYIAQVPREKSKNTQGKRKAAMSWTDKCTFTTDFAVAVKERKPAKVTTHPTKKGGRFKVQRRKPHCNVLI